MRTSLSHRRSRLVPRSIVVAVVLLALSPGPPGRPTAGEAPTSDEPITEGRLLVLNKGDNSLMVFEAPSHRLLATVPVGREPHEVAASPGGRKAWVSNVGDRTVSVVDLQSYKVVKTIRSPNLDTPHGMGVTPDGRWLMLTSEGSRRLVLIDAGRDVIARTTTTSQKGSHMIAMAQDGREAWVANRGSDTVSLVRLPELRVRRNVKVGPGPEGIAASPNGRVVAIALQGNGQVVLLDVPSQQAVASLPAGQTPIRVAFVPRSFTALVSNRGSNDVTVLDLLSRRVLSTVKVGAGPGGIAINASGSRAYVSNGGSNTVSVISIPGYEVKSEIKAGSRPDGIAFVPARGSPGGRATRQAVGGPR